MTEAWHLTDPVEKNRVKWLKCEYIEKGGGSHRRSCVNRVHGCVIW